MWLEIASTIPSNVGIVQKSQKVEEDYSSDENCWDDEDEIVESAPGWLSKEVMGIDVVTEFGWLNIEVMTEFDWLNAKMMSIGLVIYFWWTWIQVETHIPYSISQLCGQRDHNENKLAS